MRYQIRARFVPQLGASLEVRPLGVEGSYQEALHESRIEVALSQQRSPRAGRVVAGPTVLQAVEAIRKLRQFDLGVEVDLHAIGKLTSIVVEEGLAAILVETEQPTARGQIRNRRPRAIGWTDLVGAEREATRCRRRDAQIVSACTAIVQARKQGLATRTGVGVVEIVSEPDLR